MYFRCLIPYRGIGREISTAALRPAMVSPILILGGCEKLIDVPKASSVAAETMDAFPKVTLPSENVGLVEKVLSEFLWPVLGKMSNSILIVVPSGPAVDGLRSGVGQGTRTVSSHVQGFKTWFSSSVQPN